MPVVFNRFIILFLMLCGLNLWAVPGTEKGIQSLPEELQEEARATLKKYQKLQKIKPAQRKVFLDLDDGVRKSVYSKPGFFSSQDCEENAVLFAKNKSEDKGCESVGWPDNKSNIISTGNIDFRVVEDQEGNEVLRTYTEIQYSYAYEGKEKKGKGWIAQDFISLEETTPSYSDIVVQKTSALKGWFKEKWEDICGSDEPSVPQSKTSATRNNLKDIAEVSKAAEKVVDDANKQRRTVSSVSSALSSSVGMCVLKPPDKAPKAFSGNLVYDQFVLPSIQRMSLPKNVFNEDGKPLTKKELIDIDVMARTLYSEMASCADLGSQYQMAVARVLRNRKQAILENPRSAVEFITFPNEHHADKSIVARAATSPVQFSAWNQHIIDFEGLGKARKGEANALMRKKGLSAKVARAQAYKNMMPNPDTKKFYKHNESGLLHSLCPPSNPKGVCYTGEIPDPSSNFAWESSLKIAVESVLFPKQFDAKTAQLEGIKHYTSNRDRFYDFKQVKVSIEGRKFDSKVCLNLWRPKIEVGRKAEAKELKRKARPKAKSGQKK